MKTGYIYKIVSPSGKLYIGQTIDLVRRKSKYRRLSCKQQPKIYNSLLKYGWENHIFEIIEKVEFVDKSILNEREIFWIKEFNSFEDGLNLTAGGDSKEISEETREKIRLSKLGKTSPNKGKKMSDEQKKKISKKMLGNTNNRYSNKI